MVCFDFMMLMFYFCLYRLFLKYDAPPTQYLCSTQMLTGRDFQSTLNALWDSINLSTNIECKKF